MTPRMLHRALGVWAAATAIGCVLIHQWTRIEPAPLPTRASQRWALDALEAAHARRSLPSPPPEARNYRASGPIFVSAWQRGRELRRYVQPPSLIQAVQDSVRRMRNDPELQSADVIFTLNVTLGTGPIFLGAPYVSNLGVVPLQEGLASRFEKKTFYITADELQADSAFDRGVPTPLPDLKFGIDVHALVDRIARELGTDTDTLASAGEIWRFRVATIARTTYPRPHAVNETSLRSAAVRGAKFLLRHQHRDGRFMYVYDAVHGRERAAGYSVPRHSGSAYFLAEIDRLHGLPEAREGALRALRWLEREHLRHCGDPTRWCIESNGRADMGSAALTVIAASELLAHGDDPVARELVEKLTSFIRSMQRPDGELMHEYDLAAQRPIDIQRLYFSGEAAHALLKAHRVLGDERNLEAAKRLLTHLTGANWSFLGSRYYYGEEHWTCIAAAEGEDRIGASTAFEFCNRWATFNRVVQYREGETRWRSSGAYGVGPVLLPRLTPVASRTEAFISTYQMAQRRRLRDEDLRAQIERGLGMLLRWQWTPGPAHLFANPLSADGGLPGSPVELTVRNDFVQHACSAMIRWADILRREQAHASRVFDTEGAAH